MRHRQGAFDRSNLHKHLMPPRQPKIPHRNQSPTGWWIYREVEQWVSHRQKKLTPRSRCVVWVNTRIIQAKDRNAAFAKTMRLGRIGRPSETLEGEWRFAGISMLLPIYDPLEDGAEVLWDDYGSIPASKIKSMVKTRKQLAIFDDTNPDR